MKPVMLGSQLMRWARKPPSAPQKSKNPKKNRVFSSMGQTGKKFIECILFGSPAWPDA